jgi:hypothetical protein
MLLPGQRTTLAKSAPAQDFRRRNDPGLLLFGGQESAEGFRESAESPSGTSGGRIAFALGNSARAAGGGS